MWQGTIIISVDKTDVIFGLLELYSSCVKCLGRRLQQVCRFSIEIGNISVTSQKNIIKMAVVVWNGFIWHKHESVCVGAWWFSSADSAVVIWGWDACASFLSPSLLLPFSGRGRRLPVPNETLCFQTRTVFIQILSGCFVEILFGIRRGLRALVHDAAVTTASSYVIVGVFPRFWVGFVYIQGRRRVSGKSDWDFILL
jgi:hypothetical protein